MNDYRKEMQKARLLARALTLDKRTTKPPPPPNWWNRKKAELWEQHPEYTEERINRAVGHIWWHIYDDEKRKAVILAEALKP